MDVNHTGPFNPKTILSLKTLGFFLKLLLLLQNVIHNQSLMQHCLIRTEADGFPNFTSEAGSPFFFRLPVPAGHTQLSLADGDATLPHWMVFRKQSNRLAGLALTEDCGIYRLKVSVTGERCTAHFHLHILNRTGTNRNPVRDTLSCSEEEMTTWATLLLQLNPATLDANQRIRLVTTMASYLRLLLSYVSLFSQRKPFMLKQEKLRVCRQGGLAEKQAVVGDAAELVWLVGCQKEERLLDLAKVLEHSMKTGSLAKLLGAPVLGWRVICAAGEVRYKVKRDLQKRRFTPTPHAIVPPPTRIQQSVKLKHIYALPLKLEPSLSAILFHMNHIGTTHIKDSAVNAVIFNRQTFLDSSKKVSKLTCDVHAFKMRNSPQHIKQTELPPSQFKPLTEVTGCIGRVSAVTFWTTELFDSPFLPKHPSTLGHSTLNLETFSTPHSVYSSLPLTRASLSVTSTLTHEAADTDSLAIRLTRRPPQRETPFWSESWPADRTESESQSSVSSQGHTVHKEPIKDLSAAKSAPPRLPSVFHPLSIVIYYAPILSSSFKTIPLLPSANKTPPPVLFPDVSPHIIMEQLSGTRPFGTNRNVSSATSGVNQPSMSQLNVTDQDVSPTSLAGQLMMSAQTELESSLSTSLLFSLEPSVMTLTPALPSEFGVFSRQHETPDITDPLFTEQSLKVSSQMQLLQVFSTPSFPDVGVSSSQQNLEDLKTESRTEVYVDQNGLAQTLHLGVVLASLFPTSLSLSDPPEMISVPSMFQDKSFTSLQSSSGRTHAMLSVEQTIQTLLLEKSQLFESSKPFATGITTSTFFNITLLTRISPVLKTVAKTSPLPVIWTTRPASEGNVDPTAPSTAQEPYATSSSLLAPSLQPSFPLCGVFIAQDVNNCPLKIKSTSLECTLEHVLTFLTSYLPGQKYPTDSTKTLVKHYSSHLLSRNVLEEHTKSNEFASFPSFSEMSEINRVTVNQPTDLPEMLSALEGSSCSVVTHASVTLSSSDLCENFATSENSLLIWQSFVRNSRMSITTALPTRQILSWSPSMSASASLQDVGLSSYRRQSSVQPAHTSTSISSSLNLPPKVLQSIPALMATVGFLFHYTIPPKTFVDPEDGEAGALFLEMQLIDGPPVATGTWLALDGLELHGVPLEVDLQFAPQDLLLVARDSQGLAAWLPLTLDLHRSPVNPCHIFTLTAQRSLHSMLLHRHRVELLLRKLSSFFNSSSSFHLSVVSMMPGSTVVSWYNYTLCKTGHGRGSHCHADQVRGMWLAMSSADGSVNAGFREAMLPEFLITNVASVRFRQDCFPNILTFGSSTPAVQTTLGPGLGTNTSLSPSSNTQATVSPAVTPTSQQTDSYQWMAGVLTALLIVCLLILIILLIAVILYFCKGHGRSRIVAIWPAGRLLSIQSRDLTAIRPRRPPIFQPELPPPPLRLWINLSHEDEWQLPSAYDKILQPRPPQYDFSSI
uniref:Uncharacterized LOC110967438 n=1 Tax=Acanthochromis polyacanthus TaxID=80966 RepID=A0A3Q1F3U5_9TELE